MYLRLSRDDGTEGESGSITNQRFFLRQFASEHLLEICGEYSDDGLSGMRWDRPGFQSMLRAAEAGLVKTILVKDLSRLSRDYIRVGELIERWFPEHGVRLIAAADGIDTASNISANDFSPLKAVMNDWYAKDISRKVRAAISARRNAGICTAARLPYGYIRRNGEIVAVPEYAGTVRLIAEQYLSGRSFCGVAAWLNEQGIPSPGGGTWSDAGIRRILTNQAYVGVLHLHITERLSYKSRKKLQIPLQEQTVISVPPILSAIVFNAVQERISERSHNRGGNNWLSGRCRCGICGHLMTLSSGRLRCSGRLHQNGCNNPSIPANMLEDLLSAAFHENGRGAALSDLQEYCRRLTVYPDQIVCDIPMHAAAIVPAENA